MRIAYFTDTFLPQLNGVATSLANQAEALGKKGYRVLIFTPKLDNIKREKFHAKNVTIVQLPTVPALIYTEFKFGVFGLPRVIKHLSKFKPDIIHLHSPFTIGMDAMIAAKIFKKPLVGTVHVYFTNPDYLRFLKYQFAVNILNKVSKRYLNFLYRQCDLLLTGSKTLMEELNNGKLKRAVYYLPNGINLTLPKLLSSAEKSAFKKKYNLKNKVVLHFGRLSYEKNVDQLIKAFSLLTKNHNDISLFIIGDGPAKKGLSKLVRKLGIEESVIFTGFIDHKILITSGLPSIGNVFATASNMEVNPMAVLEAMFFGLPIVGVKQAGLIELVSKNGFLIEPGNTKQLSEKIEKILFDQKLTAKMSKNSLRIVKSYSIDKTTEKLLSLYEDLIAKVAIS